MKVTTKKRNAGQYAVLVDGHETTLVIEKGADPKYRHQQEWSICVDRGAHLDPLCDDQRGLSMAVGTIEAILAACQIKERVK